MRAVQNLICRGPNFRWIAAVVGRCHNYTFLGAKACFSISHHLNYFILNNNKLFANIIKSHNVSSPKVFFFLICCIASYAASENNGKCSLVTS